jgi:hypothetical protein
VAAYHADVVTVQENFRQLDLRARIVTGIVRDMNLLLLKDRLTIP